MAGTDSRLAGTAFVTGAAGGIGLATVRKLCAHSPRLRVAAVDIRDLAPLQSDLETARWYRADVADSGAISALVEQVTMELGPIEYLVNAAGMQVHGGALSLAEETWERVLKTNLTGAFFVAQSVGRKMLERQSGAIVNVTSGSQYFGMPGRLPYIVSKCGLTGLTQTLAVEWAPFGVRVNAVSPGMIETPLWSQGVTAGIYDREQAARMHAMNRIGTPEEVADAILFLLSTEASFITGETLCVDGGFRVRKA